MLRAGPEDLLNSRSPRPALAQFPKTVEIHNWQTNMSGLHAGRSLKSRPMSPCSENESPQYRYYRPNGNDCGEKTNRLDSLHRTPALNELHADKTALSAGTQIRR